MNAAGFRKFFDKNNFVEASKLYQVHNDYYSSQGYSKGKERTRYFGYCQELIADMTENGATAEEIERAIIFSYVVLSSEKFKLSILKAKDDLDIQSLYNKYVLGEEE